MTMQIDPVDEVIHKINELSQEQLQELTHKVRTTRYGVQAFVAFNYGLPNPTFESGATTQQQTETQTQTETTTQTQTKA